VKLSAAQSQLVSVDYAVTGGTAISAGVDYVLKGGALTFKDGQIENEINISIIRDGIDEDDETIELTLSKPQGAVLGAVSRHVYTIIDPRPTASFVPRRSVSRPSESPVVVTVRLSHPSTKSVTVDYRVAGGTG